MHPTSIFAYRPEIIQPKPLETSFTDQMTTSISDLSDLHQQPKNTEVLCYLSLLETNKPYLTNVFRVQGLQACLLFARSICISSDMTHYIVDNWLHLHIYDSSKAQQLLILASWLRYAWEYVIEKRLESQDSHHPLFVTKSSHVKRALGPSLKRLPPSLQRIAKEWASIVNDQVPDLDAVDISLRLSEFVDIKVENNIEKVKSSDLFIWFGTESFEENHDSFSIQVTPSLRYYPFNENESFVAPSMIVPSHHDTNVNENVNEMNPMVHSKDESNEQPLQSNQNRSQYSCPNCSKSFLFTSIEILKHKRVCKEA